MLAGKDVIIIIIAVLLKNTVSHTTRDIRSLVEASPFSPLQGGLESTTGYSIYSSHVSPCKFQPISLGGKMWFREGTSY